MVASSLATGEPVPARLRVRPGRGHVLRRRARAVETRPQGSTDVWDVLEVTGSDLSSFADEIVGYGADVVVDAPPELRDAVVDRLRAVLAVHEGAR